MITSNQMRAARALLRWSAKRLSQESEVSLPTIQRMESSDGIPKGLSRNLEAIQRTLEQAGVMFVSNNGGGVGVRFRDRDTDPINEDT